MKKFYFSVLLTLFAIGVNHAQFVDDMESYTIGQPIFQGHWTTWDCGGVEGCAIMSTDIEAHSGSKSGVIPDDGTTSAVLNLGNKIFGSWILKFSIYIPSNQGATFNIQGEVPIVDGESIVGNIFFNKSLASPGTGLIDNTALGVVTFNFPHDQWFDIIIVFDINLGVTNAEWIMWIDNEEVIPYGTDFKDSEGNSPTSLGGINFTSIDAGTNLYFIDDLDFRDFMGEIEIGIDDFKSKEFSASPNPVNDILHIKAKEHITEINLFNVLGQEIYNQEFNALNSQIDMSKFDNGIYFLKVKIDDIIGTIKIIKF